MVYGIGTVLLVLGTMMGMPFGKFEGKEKISGFDTTLVVKYMFFFVGFFFLYLSLGMTVRLSSVYSGESNITGAVNTATMVVMITMMLFLFIFVVELLFTVLKWWDFRKQKKWENRGE